MNIMQCKISYNARKSGILLPSGEFKLFNLTTLQVEKKGKLVSRTASDATLKP